MSEPPKPCPKCGPNVLVKTDPFTFERVPDLCRSCRAKRKNMVGNRGGAMGDVRRKPRGDPRGGRTKSKEEVDELRAKYVPKMHPWILTRPDIDDDVAHRAGYSSAEEMKRTQEVQHQQKDEKRRKAERREREIVPQQRRRLLVVKAELKKLIMFGSHHGDRVRASIRDRSAGERVVAANNENTRRISELKQQIKQLESVLR